MNNIAKFPLKLIKNILFVAIICTISFAAHSGTFQGKMQNSLGKNITLRFALTRDEHTRGLSGLKDKDFKITEGMLFVNQAVAPRKFWMPDTYFNLDIIFLDQNLKIVGIEKNVKAHPGMQEPPEIQKTGVYSAQYILETKADAPFSKKLNIGDQLKFVGPIGLSEIISKTHPGQ